MTPTATVGIPAEKGVKRLMTQSLGVMLVLLPPPVDGASDLPATFEKNIVAAAITPVKAGMDS